MLIKMPHEMRDKWFRRSKDRRSARLGETFQIDTYRTRTCEKNPMNYFARRFNEINKTD